MVTVPSGPAGQRPPSSLYSSQVRASGQAPAVGDGLGEAVGGVVGLGEAVDEYEAVAEGVGLGEAVGEVDQGCGPTVGLGELGSPDGN